MLDSESASGDDIPEPVVPPLGGGMLSGDAANLVARRRIERMRELKRLRELLDDPDFDELS